MDAIKGALAFKGEKGYSAYEVAVLNGFVGTEQDWLATLGSSSFFEKVGYTAVITEETKIISLPNSINYNPKTTFLSIFVNGLKIENSDYTIDEIEKTITFVETTLKIDDKVEIEGFNCLTNELPIVETINESSTNETAPGTKAVYDLVHNIFTDYEEVE